MNLGQVNIVIPLYNQETYIRQCVESCLAQTYKNKTITVVNDGSTDVSRRVLQEVIDDYMRPDAEKREAYAREVIEKGLNCADKRKELWDSLFGGRYTQSATYADFATEDLPKREQFYKEIKERGIESDDARWTLWSQYFPDGERVPPVVIDQENCGLSESRNRGIRAGEGEFILPLDADDWIEPNCLERLVLAMSDSKVGIVSPDMQYEGILHNRIPPRGTSLGHEMRSNDLPVCSLIRRAAFEQTPGYETLFVEVAGTTKVLGYEDWNMWIDILKRGWTVAAVNEPLFHYRVKPISMITQATKLHAGLVRLIHLLHPDLWPNG